MSESIRALCVRLAGAGFSVEAISKTVGLPIFDVRKTVA